MIILIRVAAEIQRLLHRGARSLPDASFEEVVEPAQLLRRLADGSHLVDAVVLGPDIEEPVQVAQRVHAVDNTIAVLILSDPSRYHQLTQTIPFALFLGPDVVCRLVEEGETLAGELREAVLRARQRRRSRATITAANAAVAGARQSHPQAAQYLDRLLDSAPIGVVTVDGQGLILAWNRQAGEILDQGKQQVFGSKLARLFPESERARLDGLIAACLLADTQLPPEILSRTAAGSRSQFVEVTATALPADADSSRALVLLQDVTARIVAEQERGRTEQQLQARVRQQATVADLGQCALAGTELSTLMDEVAALVAMTLEVEYGKILELPPHGDAFVLRAGFGWQEGAVGRATGGPSTESLAGYTLLSDRPVIVEDWHTETRFRQPALLRDHGVVSSLSVIIQGREQPFGILGADSTRRRTFTSEDVHFLQAVANVLATAIERKWNEEALATRLRYEAGLAACSQALLAAPLPDEALTQALHHLLRASGVSRVYIFENFADAEGGLCVRQTHEACREGVTPQIDNPVLQHFPYRNGFDRWPQELSTGKPIKGLVRSFPASERVILESQEILSILVIPISVGREWYGFIGFDDVEREVKWSVEDVQLLQTAAEMIGSYIERGRAEDERDRLLVREREARAEAEAAQRRLAFLAEASDLLAASLDYETTLTQVARLAVPELADLCLVDMIQEDGTIRRVAAAQANPAQAELVGRLQRRYAPDPHSSHPVATVLRTGRPALSNEIPDELLVSYARDEDHLKIARALAYRAYIVVPMTARGRTLGTISFVSTEAGRHYGPADLSLAEDLAHRAALAVDNARLYLEAQKAVRARDTFLSIASHEVRTPLATIKGYAELLRRRGAHHGTAERDQQALRSIYEQTVRLEKLIGLLLDFSRIQSGHLTIERQQVDLSALTRRLIEEMQPTLDQHTLELVIDDEPLPIAGDEVRLEQVLQNLFQNAVKYSPRGGTISVRLERQESQAQLAVSDQGIGIPAEALPQLFRPFYRAGNTGRHAIGGVGLGLFVVKEIVTLHSGRVDVHSREGHGSTFTIRLPLIDSAG